MDAKENLIQHEEKLRELVLQRSEKYKLIQDFSVSEQLSTSVIKGLEKLKREINTTQNKVNKLKEELGWSYRDIKDTELRNKMGLG